MNYSYNILEFFVISYATMFFFRLFKRKLYNILLIGVIALCTVFSGEIVNSFFTKVTSYNPAFILWIPGTGIPVFILIGGAFLSLIIFLSGEYIARISGHGRSTAWKCLSIFILSLFLPLLECAGISSGAWMWRGVVPYDLWWFVGVWQFYSVFIVIPAYAGVIILSKKQIAYITTRGAKV